MIATPRRAAPPTFHYWSSPTTTWRERIRQLSNPAPRKPYAIWSNLYVYGLDQIRLYMCTLHDVMSYGFRVRIKCATIPCSSHSICRLCASESNHFASPHSGPRLLVSISPIGITVAVTVACTATSTAALPSGAESSHQLFRRISVPLQVKLNQAKPSRFYSIPRSQCSPPTVEPSNSRTLSPPLIAKIRVMLR
jgi:hypothetical protein